MRVLVFGAEGIAGSACMRAFPDALGTTRRTVGSVRIRPNVNLSRHGAIQEAIAWAQPEVVINCVGVVKSACDNYTPETVFDVNGIIPHVIANAADVAKCRVVHLSTDCVFDGTRGGRTEEDPPDATDLYGQTKSDGELLDYAHCVTLRTSFIGVDPIHGRGLLEWLRAQTTGEASGYTNAMWSGLSASELARAIKTAIDANLTGLYHVSGPVISKADLLETLIKAYKLPCRIRRIDEPHIDRTLDGTRFAQATGYIAPSWADMARELACPSS
jgi:dTDP-4-dehydrorhamnose reductase